MKQAEQAPGTAFIGRRIKETAAVYLIALSAVEGEMQRNLQLLKEREWFDLPIVYNNDRRAVLAIEESGSSDRAFRRGVQGVDAVDGPTHGGYLKPQLMRSSFMRWLFVCVLLLLQSVHAQAAEPPDLKATFGDGCFLLTDLVSGKAIIEYGACDTRAAPCSTFKLAVALMAFDKGTLKDEHHVFKWDGVRHHREEQNQDQTARTWMQRSVVWVTQRLMHQLGEETARVYLRGFRYGNEDLSGGLDRFWLDSSLLISPREQLTFIWRFARHDLPVSAQALQLTKKIARVRKVGAARVYGKTGTGCLDPDCDVEPGRRMHGWFVGFLEIGKRRLAFAAHMDDAIPHPKMWPAGPRLRDKVIALLESLELTK